MKRFICFMLLFSFAVCFCSCSSPAAVNDRQTTETTTKESMNFKIGDEIFIKKDSGEYKLVITKAEETAERNPFDKTNPERVIIISYDYENISYSSDLYISNMNFKAYDKDNNSMDTYPASVNYPNAISAGRKASGQMAYGLNSAANYAELEFYDNMFMSSDCKIILEW